MFLPVLLCLLLPCPLAAADSATGADKRIAATRTRELVRIVRQDCGSCHGMTLKGGLGTPLLPENLRDKPTDGLVTTILQGRPGSAMPPWAGLLREEEAAWIVERLRTGFPEETP